MALSRKKLAVQFKPDTQVDAIKEEKKPYRKKPKQYRTRLKKQGIHIIDETKKTLNSTTVKNYCEINLVDRYTRFAKIAWNVEDKTLVVLGYGDEVLAEFTAQTLGHGDRYEV
jgi:hypothetical protein